MALEDLREELRAALLALPELDAAGRPYRDARLFVEHAAPNNVREYLDDVVGRVRTLLRAYRAPAPARPRTVAPAVPDAERMRRYRERVAAVEAASVRAWLEVLLEFEDADLDEDEDAGTPVRPGAVVPAALLREMCLEALEEWIEDGEETDDGDALRIPRDRIFHAVADEVLGSRRRVGKARTSSYTMPG